MIELHSSMRSRMWTLPQSYTDRERHKNRITPSCEWYNKNHGPTHESTV